MFTVIASTRATLESASTAHNELHAFLKEYYKKYAMTLAEKRVSVRITLDTDELPGGRNPLKLALEKQFGGKHFVIVHKS